MGMTIGAIVVTVLLAGFAVNRHLQLKRSYAEVERIVAIRTRELERANHELLQDQKMKALGTLASGIAHDFNSILSIIKGSVQIIEANSTNAEKVRKRVDRIHSVIDQGAGIVRSMLGYVRRKNEPSQPHDLNRITREAIQLTEENTTGHRIEFLDNPSIGKVTIVPDLIRQILINLINNAMDSMETEGCILIRLEETREFSGHVALKPKNEAPFAVLRIQDSGVGISHEIVSRIFEPFYTTKAFSSRRGTGLGLSMVYEMAREMGAGLSVTSSPGKGSLFSIYISLSDQTSSFAASSNTAAEDFRTK
jgi:signal transduction histidine kinase